MGARTQAKTLLLGYRNADPVEYGLAVSSTAVPVWVNEDSKQCAIAGLVVRNGVDGQTFTITVDGVSIPFPLKTNLPLGLDFGQNEELYISDTKQEAPTGGISFSASAPVVVDYRLRIIG